MTEREKAFNELAGDTMDLLTEAIRQLKAMDVDTTEMAKSALKLCSRGMILCFEKEAD